MRPRRRWRPCTTISASSAVIVQASCHGADNRAMLDAIVWRPDRYRGVATIDESYGEAELHDLHRGVRGVRFNFVRHLGGTPDMDLFHRMMDQIHELGWHVVPHVDAPDTVPLSPMMRQLPMPFVINHMGRIDSALGSSSLR
jgi:predicted TIM-barrel fold metal-dependent hydrolase